MPSRFKPKLEIDKYHRRIKFRHGEPSDKRLNLLIDFGMPDLDDRISIQWAGRYFDPKFKGYKVELFGVEEWRGVKKRRLVPEPRKRLLKEMPHRVLLKVLDAREGCFSFTHHYAFHVWLCRVRGPGQQIISEEIWQPQNGWVQTARNVASTISEDARSLLRFIEAPRGGDTRKEEIKQLWADEDVLKRFAHLVDELYPGWTSIKSQAYFCNSEEAREEWADSVLDRRRAVKDFVDAHPKLTREILMRAVDSTLKPINREPLLLACFHAALELEVIINGETLTIYDAYMEYRKKPPAPSTLKTFYDNGKALLDQSE